MGLSDCGTGGKENGEDQNLSFSREGCLDAFVRQSEYVGSSECARHTRSSQSACLEGNGIIYKGEVVGVERVLLHSRGWEKNKEGEGKQGNLSCQALWLWRG